MKEIVFIVEHPLAELRTFVTFARAKERYEHIFKEYLDEGGENDAKRKREIFVWRAECTRLDPETFEDY